MQPSGVQNIVQIHLCWAIMVRKKPQCPQIPKGQNMSSLSLPSESGSDPAMFRMLWRVCDETWKLPSTSEVHATCPPQYELN